MADYNRIPRTATNQPPEEEIKEKIITGLAHQKKRTENRLNPHSVISTPIEITKVEITKEKSKMKKGILGIFKK